MELRASSLNARFLLRTSRFCSSFALCTIILICLGMKFLFHKPIVIKYKGPALCAIIVVNTLLFFYYILFVQFSRFFFLNKSQYKSLAENILN